MTAQLTERAPSSSDATLHRLPRRIPRPVSEPPYDDERGFELDAMPMQGALALDLGRTSGTAAAYETWRLPRHLSLVASGPELLEDDDLFFARQPTPRAELPDPKPFCGRYVQALVEVLGGERPVTQLMRWTSENIYAELEARVRSMGRSRGGVVRRAGVAASAVPAARGVRPVRRAAGPASAARRAGPTTPERVRTVVRSVHVQEPDDGVAEAAVHVQHAGRARAVALRLEGLDGHWRCTALQFG